MKTTLTRPGMRPSRARAITLCGLLALLASPAFAQEKFLSHPPQRPLPEASVRPLADGPAYYVDGKQGRDDNPGTKDRPWKTVQHGVDRVRPGETLILRGGIYYEHIVVKNSGIEAQPITIRSQPGELVVLDGGLREFFDSPATSWEPCPSGVAGEFWSTKTYPDLGGRPDETNVLGLFGDSWIPLHGYKSLKDLRSDNHYWNLGDKLDFENGIYSVPGIHYDPTTQRIHVRLAPTQLSGLHENNYKGEADPRKLPLVVAGFQGGPVLSLENLEHVRLVDLVVRGAREATVEILRCKQIVCDGLTVFGGAAAFRVLDTHGFRLVNCVCRGIAAPWTFRSSLKYRAIEARIFAASSWAPSGCDNRDFELAYSEFTDCVDGIFLGNVRNVHFHHNYVDNISDDGLFLTAATGFDGTTPGGDFEISQNYFSRCLTVFAFGVGHGRQKALASGYQTGSGGTIARNVFDLRGPAMYFPPKSPSDPQELTFRGRLLGDHGSPAWEPIFFAHNTVVNAEAPFRAMYGAGLAGGMGKGTQRRVFNNIFLTTLEQPGTVLPDPKTDFQADANLHWSLPEGPKFSGKYFARFQNSPSYKASQEKYPPGWTSRDLYADPRLKSTPADWKQPLAAQLLDGSPAVDAGLSLPADIRDPLRSADQGPPDLGALPQGAEPWRIGVRGRWTWTGAKSAADAPPQFSLRDFAPPDDSVKIRTDLRPVVLMQGYPAFDATLLEYAFRRQGVALDSLEKTWLPPRAYANYGTVVIAGDLARAKIVPHQYSEEDLSQVRAFLEQGGTLLLMRGTAAIFGTPAGKAFLAELTGPGPTEKGPAATIRSPQHPWIKHLDPQAEHPWLQAKNAVPLRASRGECLLGSAAGSGWLTRIPVGRGQLIYLGWEIADSLPHGRLPATLAQELLYEEQSRIVFNIAADVCGSNAPRK